MTTRKKLPTVGTSAASTAFCSAVVKFGLGDHYGGELTIDGNGKITRDQGDLDHPVPNAFSLPAQAVEDRAAGIASDQTRMAMEHCPGSTPACRSTCYVDGLAKHAAETYAAYKRNALMIRLALADPELASAACMAMSDHLNRHCLSFRWHVSGDVFSADYARWIADVCRETPTVQHWIYTRSFAPEILDELVAVSTLRGGNLALNLSCDRDNVDAAADASMRYGLRLCYLVLDPTEKIPILVPQSDVIFPDYKLRGGTEEGRAWFASLSSHQKSMVCPVDYNGKAENRRCGPCSRCLT